jgi:hypothetical protein
MSTTAFLQIVPINNIGIIFLIIHRPKKVPKNRLKKEIGFKPNLRKIINMITIF